MIKALKTPLRYPGGKSKAIKTLTPWFPKIISEYRDQCIIIDISGTTEDRVNRIKSVLDNIY